MVEDKKASTMSSMFLGSTLEKPNVELIINAVATILHSQMLEVGTLPSQVYACHFQGIALITGSIYILEKLSLSADILKTSSYIGPESREDHSIGKRPLLLLRGEVHPG